MLGIHRSYNGKAASKYFSKSLSHEGEYYLDKKIKAVWSGRIAKRMGIEGKEVTKEDFDNLVNGIHPITLQSVKVRKREAARAGYDLTFSAPKSVSIALSITKNQEILKAHQNAYLETINEIQSLVQTQNNTFRGRGYETTAELLIAPFDHFLSRPCQSIDKNGKKIYVADPQLHTHCYIPNVTYSHEKNRYQAIELGNIHRQAKYFEAAYHARLANNLQDIGFKIRQTKDRFELVGIERKLIEKFSNRSLEIDKVALEQGITDKAEKARLSIKTRNSKAKGLNEEKQYQHWIDRLTQKEFEGILKLKAQPNINEDKIDPQTAIQRSIDHYSERNSAWKERDVLGYALKLGLGSSLLPEDVQNALNKRKDIVKANFDTVPYITSHRMIFEEQSLVSGAVSLKGKYSPINEHFKPTLSYLNEPQERAIKGLLNSKDGVVALRGYAGSGKSTVISQLHQAHLEVGKNLISITPTSQAAKVLKDKGHSNADTIAGFLLKTREHQKLYGATILCDEAGMAGTKTMNQLITLAKEKQARLWLLGDTQQHSPPAQYGNAMRHLIDQAKIQTFNVNKIVRQSKNKALKSAVESLAKNRTLEGYKKLDKMGCVKELPPDERLSKISEKYVNAVKAKESVLVVAPTVAENNEINQAIRLKMKEVKMIVGSEKEFMSLRNLSLTNDEKKNPVNYEPGQIVRFINNAKGNFKAGAHYEILESKKPSDIEIRNLQTGLTSKLPLGHHDKYQVFSQSHIKLAKGDYIKVTANSKTIEGSKALNGTSYHVTGFTKSGDIKLDNNKTLKKDIGHIRYAACDTSHGSQGKDANNVIVSVSDLSFSTASREQLYVSVSRGKKSALLLTSDKSQLQKAIIKTEKEMSAQDVAKENAKHVLQRNRHNHHRSLNEKIREYEQQRDRQQQPTKHISLQTKSRDRE